MKRKLAKTMSHERVIDIYYNGGVEGAEEHECYRLHVTLATNAERLQLQAFATEAGIEINKTALELEGAALEGLPKEKKEDAKKDSWTNARVAANLEHQKKQNAYARRGEMPPDELHSRQIMARHIRRIELVQIAEDGSEEIFEAVFNLGEEELSWQEMDATQRLDLVGIHIIMFLKAMPIIIPNATSGVLGKSEMQRAKADAKTKA